MIRKLTFTVWYSILLLPVASLSAGPLGERFSFEPGGHKFEGAETTFDVFTSLQVPENREFFDGRLGAGLGFNHFFTSWLGAGIDTRVDEFDWPNHINGSLLLRYPVKKSSLAPYGLLGFGRQFSDPAQWTFHFGVGVDYRLNKKTGLFADVRQNLPDVSRDFTVWRFGIRLGF